MRILFPAIYREHYIAFVFLRVGNRPLLAALTFFSFYWAIPFVATLVPVLCGNRDSAELFTCIKGRALQYLVDPVHLAFSIVASIIVFFAYQFVMDFHIQISRLALTRGKSSTRETLLCEYRNTLNAPFHGLSLLAYLCVAVATTLLFWDRIFDLEYSHWWGNIQNGISGLAYISIMAMFTFFATKYLFFLTSASIFLVRYFARHMQILPYDPDGMSGLSSAGVVIIRIWRQAALLAVCLYLVFSTNYLDISHHWVVWLLASLVICILPFAALVPFAFLALEAIRQKRLFRGKILRSLNPKVHRGFDPLMAVRHAEVSEAIDKLVVLPIKGWRFLAIASLNLIQLYVSVDAIWKGLPI